jgi:hypothetical protein
MQGFSLGRNGDRRRLIEEGPTLGRYKGGHLQADKHGGSEMTLLRRVQLTGVAGVTALAVGLGVTGSAFAIGQPGVTAGNECRVTASAEMTPGKSVSASGSPFNPEGKAGLVYAGNPETASKEHANYPLAKAVSQYDVACVQATSH